MDLLLFLAKLSINELNLNVKTHHTKFIFGIYATGAELARPSRHSHPDGSAFLGVHLRMNLCACSGWSGTEPVDTSIEVPQQQSPASGCFFESDAAGLIKIAGVPLNIETDGSVRFWKTIGGHPQN